MKQVEASELPELIPRNALLLLRYLLERERHSGSGLSKILAIEEVIRLTQHETSDLIDIVDSKGAIKANRSIAGGAAPMLTGSGKLMLEVLSEELGAKDAQAHQSPRSETSPEPQEFEPHSNRMRTARAV
jgi:hypothetical protein